MNSFFFDFIKEKIFKDMVKITDSILLCDFIFSNNVSYKTGRVSNPNLIRRYYSIRRHHWIRTNNWIFTYFNSFTNNCIWSDKNAFFNLATNKSAIFWNNNSIVDNCIRNLWVFPVSVKCYNRCIIMNLDFFSNNNFV